MVASDPSNFSLRVCTFDPLSPHPFGTVRSSLPYHFSDDGDQDEGVASSLNEQKEQPAYKAYSLPSDTIQPTAQPWRDMPTPSWMLGPQWCSCHPHVLPFFFSGSARRQMMVSTSFRISSTLLVLAVLKCEGCTYMHMYTLTSDALCHSTDRE